MRYLARIGSFQVNCVSKLTVSLLVRSSGGNVLAEVFTNIRTVYALELQEQLHGSYLRDTRVRGKCKKR